VGVIYYYWLQEISLEGVQKEIGMITASLTPPAPVAQPSLYLPLIENTP
jgi:hypothetical protein